jgi:hypothetical protein
MTGCFGGGGSIKVESITISGPTLVGVGNTNVQYTATILPTNASVTGFMTWAIASGTGATINSSGVLNATAAGNITITANVDGVTSAPLSVSIQVIDATAIAVHNINTTVGASINLDIVTTPANATRTAITYELVSNTIGATLTNGIVTSTKNGSVTYKATMGALESNVGTINFNLNSAYGTTISTRAQLENITRNGAYQLGADIDLSGSNWTPLYPTIGAPFIGSLRGNGYTISNMTIAPSVVETGTGLFGNIGTNGVVRDIKVLNASVNSPFAGIIAGRSNGTITNCEVSGTIGSSTRNNVGGIVGIQTSVSTLLNLDNNKNSATVIGNERVGGIVGELNLGTGNRVFTNCENTGSVTGATRVGGIAGIITASHPGGTNTVQLNSTVSSHTNTGNVTATSERVGGIVGSVSGGQGFAPSTLHRITIQGVSNSGVINGGNMTGGLVGFADRVPSITGENTGNVTGAHFVGGILGDGRDTALSGFTNTNTITGVAVVGGIAGRARTVTNSNNGTAVSNTASVTATGTATVDIRPIDSQNANANNTLGAFVGGVVGICEGASVSNRNFANMTITGGGSFIGGIAGFVNTHDITGCENRGNISAATSDKVGGIVGGAHIRFRNSLLQNNTNIGNVTGKDEVGGIAGEYRTLHSGGTISSSYTSTISGCDNQGTITGQTRVGGIVGWVSAGMVQYLGHNINIASCQNSGTVTGTENATNGGIVGGMAIGSFTERITINAGSMTSPAGLVNGGAGHAIAPRGV